MAVARSQVRANTSEAMFRSNLEDIKSRFAVLQQNIGSTLEANHVTVQAVRGVLVGMYPNCEDHIPKTNMEDIFSAATRHKLWSYEHHSPLDKLVRRLLGHGYLSDIREYKAHLSGFYATNELIEYIQHTNIDPAMESSEIDLEQFTVAQYQKLMVKLELDRNIDGISLKYIQDLWEEFAEEFNIPYLTAVIGKIMGGSLVIIWLISPDVAKKIASSANNSIQFFQKHQIVYVAIDGIPVYEVGIIINCRQYYIILRD